MEDAGPADRFARFFGQHMVGLAWIDAPRDGARPADSRYCVASGFVVQAGDQWFLVTAGHIIEDLVKCAKHPAMPRQIVSSSLLDGWHREDGKITHIPFPLPLEGIAFLNVADADFTAIPLSPLYQAALQKNGVTPAPAESWSKGRAEHDLYVMVGFPSQLRETSKSLIGCDEAQFAVSMSMPIVPLRLTDHLPEYYQDGSDCLHAEVRLPPVLDHNDKPIRFDDIDGMSGGAVFGVRREQDGRFRYWLVAVQGGWVKGSRIIRATWVAPFIDVIRDELKARSDPAA
jgi:hypothetical protein